MPGIRGFPNYSCTKHLFLCNPKHHLSYNELQILLFGSFKDKGLTTSAMKGKLRGKGRGK